MAVKKKSRSKQSKQRGAKSRVRGQKKARPAFGSAFADGVPPERVRGAPPVGGGRDTDVVSLEVLCAPEDPERSPFLQPRPVAGEDVHRFRLSESRLNQTAIQLKQAGFDVLHVDAYGISAQGERGLFEKCFGTRLKVSQAPKNRHRPHLGSISFYEPIPESGFAVPDYLSQVERAYVQPPAVFMGAPSAFPPRVSYWHLRVPDDVSTLLRATLVHRNYITGWGVTVAMPDTGFAPHAFYDAHGYSYSSVLAPDASGPNHDEVGHGTAEAANVFATAPDVSLIGVKQGQNSTLAFKTAVAQNPKVITCSWGFSVDTPDATRLPNRLKALELAVADAVARGIVVVFAAGNGHYAFPGSHPDVISVGGVYVDADQSLRASDYASSFGSTIYPGRHVPDVCGLVGMRPAATYIMLPIDPQSEIDRGTAEAGPYPAGDETQVGDGWSCISGTSAATPQVAGLVALLLEEKPDLSPAEVRSVLQRTARDVEQGQSAHGEPAGPGPDSATGQGLVDGHAAWRMVH